ncbi:hypothetical protein CYMTET_15307, partial [Cymbomonas tetramitiformis]
HAADPARIRIAGVVEWSEDESAVQLVPEAFRAELHWSRVRQLCLRGQGGSQRGDGLANIAGDNHPAAARDHRKGTGGRENNGKGAHGKGFSGKGKGNGGRGYGTKGSADKGEAGAKGIGGKGGRSMGGGGKVHYHSGRVFDGKGSGGEGRARINGSSNRYSQ